MDRFRSNLIVSIFQGLLVVAEGRHAKLHEYRTHAFVFSWSLWSAAYGSRAHTHDDDDDDDDAQYGAQTSQPVLYMQAAYTY